MPHFDHFPRPGESDSYVLCFLRAKPPFRHWQDFSLAHFPTGKKTLPRLNFSRQPLSREKLYNVLLRKAAV